MQQTYEEEPVIIEMEEVHKPKNKLASKICNIFYKFFNGLLIFTIGFILGAGTIIVLVFIYNK